MKDRWISIAKISLKTIFILIVLWGAAILTVSVGWSGIIPQVFLGAVREGLLLDHLTPLQAVKMILLVGMVFRKRGYIPKEESNSDGPWLFLLRFIAGNLLEIGGRGVLLFLIWPWCVLDIFPLAVARGLIPGTITIWHGILLSLLSWVVAL